VGESELNTKSFKGLPTPDTDLVEIVYQEHLKNAELALVHLRDARNLLYAIPELSGNRAFSKATILLAGAALESNLAYLSCVALGFINARPKLYSRPHEEFLRGLAEEIDDNGKLVKKKLRQSVFDRMQVVPQLLARGVGRHYQMPKSSAAAKKMQRTIDRRDAIIHPKWDRYIDATGWWEAAEAIDAIELYLESVRVCLHPYLVSYAWNLVTIKGPTKNDVGIGHRTYGKSGPKIQFSTMADVGIVEVLLREWHDAMLMVMVALTQGTDQESEGSMLTRSALVLVYAMLDAQLSVVSQWKLRETPGAFKQEEILFLNEAAIGVGHDGEVWVDSDQHPFKKRIKAIPAVLARCCEGKEFAITLSNKWGADLLLGYTLRSSVMHSIPGQKMPIISKDELRRSALAVRSYFASLADNLPKTFGFMHTLLGDADRFMP
jgi:hypothetical protein